MNKIFKTALAVVAVAAVGMSSFKAYGSYSSNVSSDELFSEDVLALSDNTPAKHKVTQDGSCYNGGPGATSCSIDAGITIMGCGVSAGGSVTCSGSTYACCGVRCTCKPLYV